MKLDRRERIAEIRKDMASLQESLGYGYGKVRLKPLVRRLADIVAELVDLEFTEQNHKTRIQHVEKGSGV